jgi:hypothetical protein
MTITAVSVLVAVLIGAIETLGLVRAQFDLEGPLWGYIGALNENFGVLGYVIIGVFIISWRASVLIYADTTISISGSARRNGRGSHRRYVAARAHAVLPAAAHEFWVDMLFFRPAKAKIGD